MTFFFFLRSTENSEKSTRTQKFWPPKKQILPPLEHRSGSGTGHKCPPLQLLYGNYQRWSRGHKAQGQGHKKIRGQGQVVVVVVVYFKASEV